MNHSRQKSGYVKMLEKQLHNNVEYNMYTVQYKYSMLKKDHLILKCLLTRTHLPPGVAVFLSQILLTIFTHETHPSQLVLNEFANNSSKHAL